MSDVIKQATFDATLIKAEYAKSKYDDNLKYRLNFSVPDGFDFSIFDEAYAKKDEAFRPDWYKKKGKYINLASSYDVPTKTSDGIKTKISELIKDCNTLIGSKISLKVNLKEGAVYPYAMIIREPGDAKDPFLDFE